MCLFLGRREWDASKPVADTVVPWAVEWLFFYELWLATGDWLGDGEHPPAGPVNRRARRQLQRPKDDTLQRLTSALTAAYGESADVHELLTNSRLKAARAA